MENNGKVELGFVEKVEPWRLLSHFFPSKIGGKPAWLALDNVPKADNIKCMKCGEPCIFLLQVFAPKEHLIPSAFHRTLFVFVCKDPKCNELNKNSNVIVLRSQLPRENNFFSTSPPNENDFDSDSVDYPKATDYQTLCSVCGCSGQGKCGKCKKVSYCCKNHQKADWITGHKKFCGQDCKDAQSNPGILFPEFELVIDSDGEEEEDEAEDTEKNEAKEMAEYDKVLKTMNDKNVPQLSAEELEQVAGNVEEDKKFSLFKQIMEKDPEQVIRYQWGGQPLWVTDCHIPQPNDIPSCEYCNCSRHFEFQVMSTLLSHIEVDCLENSIDWGTLVIYSCSKSCNAGGNYGQEFVWKQDFVN